MIKNGFLLCPECEKKIQPVCDKDTINATVYCSNCKLYYKIVVANEELYYIESK